MESFDRSVATPSKGRLVRAFAKVLHIRSVAGAGSAQRHNSKSQENIKFGKWTDNNSQPFDGEEEKLRNRAAIEAFVSKLFASLSSVKAGYAQLQFAQAPYDADGIQLADQMIVSELKTLSELKQSYIKKQIDDSSPENTQLMAEIQEQKCLLKIYEITVKKMDSQLKLKDSEITFLREKLEETNTENKMLEKRLNTSGQIPVPDNLHITGLSASHFLAVLQQTVKSIRSFVRLMIDEMESSGWDLDAAARSIEPEIVFLNCKHKCFAFESYVCRKMFEGFNHPTFSPKIEFLPDPKKRQELFFDQFVQLKSLKSKEYLTRKPKSMFGKFCRTKYLLLFPSKIESSLVGNLNQRNLVKSGRFPETAFFASFAEMARRVWLLHCLSFSFLPEASIFQAEKGSRFSDVYMECVNEEAFLMADGSSGSDPRVALTVVPGFKIGKTVIQCQIYLNS